MPPVEGGAELIAILFEIGPTMAAGMGAGPITYGEIESWCRLTGTRLSPSRVRMLRHLSRVYLNESMKGSVQPPWLAPEAKPEVTSTQAALRALATL